jgi:hypothetical protein
MKRLLILLCLAVLTTMSAPPASAQTHSYCYECVYAVYRGIGPCGSGGCVECQPAGTNEPGYTECFGPFTDTVCPWQGACNQNELGDRQEPDGSPIVAPDNQHMHFAPDSWIGANCEGYEPPYIPPPPNDDEQTPGPCGGPSCGTPLLLSLSGGPIRLSEVPVSFDLRGTGIAEQWTWTEAGSDTAFIAYDWNGDGQINSGRELFGDKGSPQRPINGFIDLSAYDKNRDGLVDHNDPVWSGLWLWADRNHDGKSTPAELTRIADTRISALEYEYRRVGRRDPSGALLLYQARYWVDGQPRMYYDAYFRIATTP